MIRSAFSAIAALLALIALIYFVSSALNRPVSPPSNDWQIGHSSDTVRSTSIDGAFLNSSSEKPLYMGAMYSRAVISLASTREVPIAVGLRVPGAYISCLKTGCKALAKFDKEPVSELGYFTGGWPMASRVHLENPVNFYNKLLKNKKLILEIELADFSTQQFEFELSPPPQSFHALVSARVEKISGRD